MESIEIKNRLIVLGRGVGGIKGDYLMAIPSFWGDEMF
jgi:hypothetical protein